MKKQLALFFTAVMFYTRIPCPKHIDHDSTYLNQATRYFPLIGWVVGGLSCLSYFVSWYLFTPEISILLSLVTGILITGAFHEDGFADVCDGFGGGWTKEKILKIMKDSAIGAYGAIGLFFLFSLKYIALLQITNFMVTHEKKSTLFILLLYISYHSISRLNAISLSFVVPYVREDELSKSKPIAKGYSWVEVVGAALFGLAPLFIFSIVYHPLLLTIIPILIITLYYMKYYFTKWIKGYTGDCLGALEQISETITLLTILCLCKFI